MAFYLEIEVSHSNRTKEKIVTVHFRKANYLHFYCAMLFYVYASVLCV